MGRHSRFTEGALDALWTLGGLILVLLICSIPLVVGLGPFVLWNWVSH